MWAPLLSLASPGGARGRLTTLIFHRVHRTRDPLFPDEVDAAEFDALCGRLRRHFNVLPLDQAVQRLAEGRLPPRAAAITFDDGYADNHDVALPILQRHGLSATFFIATGFIDGGRMWNDTVIESVRDCRLEALDADDLPGGVSAGRLPLADAAQRRAAIDTLLRAIKHRPPAQRADAVAEVQRRAGVVPGGSPMMTSAQVRALHDAGMPIGAHTQTHPILATLDAPAMRREIGASRDWLENLLQARVALFAYPNGKPHTDYTADAVRIVRELGFDAAVSTAPGAASAASDRHQLPRFTPWDRRGWRFDAQLLRNLLAAPAPVLP